MGRHLWTKHGNVEMKVIGRSYRSSNLQVGYSVPHLNLAREQSTSVGNGPESKKSVLDYGLAVSDFKHFEGVFCGGYPFLLLLLFFLSDNPLLLFDS